MRPLPLARLVLWLRLLRLAGQPLLNQALLHRPRLSPALLNQALSSRLLSAPQVLRRSLVPSHLLRVFRSGLHLRFIQPAKSPSPAVPQRLPTAQPTLPGWSRPLLLSEPLCVLSRRPLQLVKPLRLLRRLQLFTPLRSLQLPRLLKLPQL